MSSSWSFAGHEISNKNLSLHLTRFKGSNIVASSDLFGLERRGSGVERRWNASLRLSIIGLALS